MKTFLKDPLKILLAFFAGFSMLRSLVALLEALTTEPARIRTASLYLILFIALFVGVYLIFQPQPTDSKDAFEIKQPKMDRKGSGGGYPGREMLISRLFGAILLTLAASLILNTWLMPYLSISPTLQEPSETPGNLVSETPPATSTRESSATIPAATATPTMNPTSARTSTPTPPPIGIRMQVVLARVHVRLEPSSQSASMGELNHGDWLYFDGRTSDPEGILWLRVGPDQARPEFQNFVGSWVFVGGLDSVGLEDLPLLPATATPAG